MPEKTLRFILTTSDGAFRAGDRFFPNGQQVLNSTEWRGKPPTTCGVIRLRTRPRAEGTPTLVDVDVAYRPPGFIWFSGDTKFDGWQQVVMKRAENGSMLDGDGNPLKLGEPPVFVRINVHPTMDFNEIDFGEFVDEVETPGVKHLTHEEAMGKINELSEITGRLSMGLDLTFLVAHRRRPYVKILITDKSDTRAVRAPYISHTQIDFVGKDSSDRTYLIYTKMTALVAGFLEGRLNLKTCASGDGILLELADVIVDTTKGPQTGERFGNLDEYLPGDMLEEMAKHIASVFDVEVQVVDGPVGGLLLRRPPSED